MSVQMRPRTPTGEETGTTLETQIRRTAELLEALCPVLPMVKERGRATHMGALLADAALQPGLHYSSVVQPRVQALAFAYPGAANLSGLNKLLQRCSPKSLLQWSNPVKPARFVALVRACTAAGVESCTDFSEWVIRDDAKDTLNQIPGIGPKTIDYLCLLAGHGVVPLDRHFLRFLRFAGVPASDRAYAQNVFAQACELSGLDLRSTERALWLLFQSCA
jgi:hypothetical protein